MAICTLRNILYPMVQTHNEHEVMAFNFYKHALTVIYHGLEQIGAIIIVILFTMLSCNNGPTSSNGPISTNEWLPLAIGNSWTLRDTTMNNTLVITVDSIQVKNGVQYFQLKNFSPSLLRSDSEKMYAFDTYESSDVTYLDVTQSSINTHFNKSDINVTLIDQFDSIMINDHIYRNVRKYDIHYKQIIDADQVVYLCKNIGIIKYGLFGAGVYDWNLQEYVIK
jgi:hypothetical protein